MYHKCVDNSEKGGISEIIRQISGRFGSTTNAGSKLSSLTQRERA